MSELELIKITLRLFFCILLLRNGSSTSAPNVEGEVLMDVLAVLKDPNNKIDWSLNLTTPCSSWSHVTCLSGRVTYLSLSSIGFLGSLSPAICKKLFSKVPFFSFVSIYNSSYTALIY